jgi:uncharacterized damage-inducible protein DinB
MKRDYIEELYEYNQWANLRVLAAVSEITTDLFTRDMGNSFPSIRDTLTHILSAEWIWLRRWHGESPKAMLNASELSSLEVLKSRWSEIQRAQTEFIRSLTEDLLDGRIRYANIRGEENEYPLWQMMQHVVNHSTYHRGQVTTMLRQLGAKPLSTDLLVFHDTKART